MEPEELDALIGDLEHMVSSSFSPLTGRVVTHRDDLIAGTTVYDWRPAWDKAHEIQDIFKAGVRYPTRTERDQAWVRFNNVRNDLSARANADRETVFSVSQSWRDKAVEELHGLRYTFVPILDDINPTTAEEMKVLGQRLKEVRNLLHENKHQMLKQHKEECYALVEEIKQSHDWFWERYHASREERRRAHVSAMRERLEKTNSNIERNEEKRDKAANALERCEANIEKVAGMLSEARSDEHRERVEGWLAEAIEKRASILESIQRLNEWIGQDIERRDELMSKIAARE